MHRIASFELIMNVSSHGVFPTFSGCAGCAREQILACASPRSRDALRRYARLSGRVSGWEKACDFEVARERVKHKVQN